MRKIILLTTLTLLAPLCGAQDMPKALAFYKQELSAFPAQNSSDTRAYAKALANGLDTWILQNEKKTPVQDALLWQAQLLARAQDNAATLVTLLKLRFLFPQQDTAALTPIFQEAINGVDKNSRDEANRLWTQGPREKTADSPAREAQLLYGLSKLSGKNFYPVAAAAFERFFARYPDYSAANEAELWYGDLHRGNKNYLAAISQYKKADVLYPNSPYKAASLRLIGDIYADNLRNTAAATEAYTTVLRLYPHSSELGIVYKHMAILDENNNQYDSALINYDKAIELLGDASAVYEAYRGKMDVYMKMNDYQNAYNVLHQAAALPNLPKVKAVQTLCEAAQLARKQLASDTQYTQSLEKAILLAPTLNETEPVMYELATAYEKQGKTAQAQEMYKKLILQFPTGKHASKAQRRLDKLSK